MTRGIISADFNHVLQLIRRTVASLSQDANYQYGLVQMAGNTYLDLPFDDNAIRFDGGVATTRRIGGILRLPHSIQSLATRGFSERNVSTKFQ